MHLGGDERSQSVQIGAIILFGAIIILLSTYQAFVVPSQNREVEFKHNQEVQNDMKELRSALLSASDGSSSSVTVQLGTEYPSRAVFVNPGSPSGSLRTVGTTNQSVAVRIVNASASGDAGDFWNGTAHTYSTGSLVYAPNYNIYSNAPRTVYSNTVLYNDFGGQNLTLTDQSFINGRSISLVALNGSMSMGQSGAVSVDVRPRSVSSTRVAVTNESSPITLELSTRLNESTWEQLLKSQRVANGGHVKSVNVTNGSVNGFETVVLKLEQDVTYNLKLSKVSVGSAGGSDPGAAYLVKTDGDGTVVPEGGRTTIEVTARDRYNNPVSGEVVQANATRGGFVDGEDVAETGSDGTATFVYEAPASVSGGSVSETINVSLDAGTHDASNPGDVSFGLTVTSGGSDTPPYTVAFDTARMDSANPGLTCGANACTYDFGKDKSDTGFEVTAETIEPVVRTDVDFALNTTTYGAYTAEDTETDRFGEATAFFTANNTGAVRQFVSSGASSDGLNVTLVDTSKLISAFDNDPTGDDSKYEFVRLYFAEATNTGGWTLEDDEGASQITNLPNEQLSGEVYFARNGSAFADRWGIPKSDVYNMSTRLANSGEPLWLNDSSGTVVDNIEYDDNSEDSTDGIVNMENSSDVGVRRFTDGTYPYRDTNDNDADWQKKDESAVLGTVGGGSGFQSQSVSDLLPSTTGQRQTFTFTPDSDLLSGTQVTINLTEAQQTSPRQVDYQGGFNSASVGSASLNKKNSEVAFLNWSASSTVSAGTTVEIIITGVKTGPGVNQNNPYSVGFTREDSGGSTTGSFEVGRNTGGSELTSLSVEDLTTSTNGQTQEIVFEPTTTLTTDEAVQIDLSDAAGTDDVDYSSASVSVNRSSNDLTFTDQNTDNASIRYRPGSDLAAGTPVKITVSSITTGSMPNAPYTVGIGRSKAGTQSTTFGTTQASQVEAVSGSTPGSGSTQLEFDIRNTGSSSVTITDFAISTPGNQNSGVTTVDNIDESPGKAEVQIGGGSANPDNPPTDSNYDTDGTTYPLNSTASISNGGTASVTMGEFNDGNVALTYQLTSSESNADVTVTLTFGDGSTREYYFRVTNVNS